jgi:hypothetical protein
MSEVETIPTKYIFLDIVSFTHKRSIEAQSDLVSAINSIVNESIKALKVPSEKIIFLPTGDGMCICLLNIESPYDVHVLLSLNILLELKRWNENTSDQMRRFKIRIGLNANVDNLVIDINGRQNLAGAGINIAQRVMSAADGNQILVGPVVYETLKEREKYMNKFRSYSITVKHGVGLMVHQYIEQGRDGLDTATPVQFVAQEKKEPRLSEFAAYYLAHAMDLQELFVQHTGDSSMADAAAMLLWVLAKDSVEAAQRSQFDKHRPWLWKSGSATPDQQLQHYREVDLAIRHQFGYYISSLLTQYADCFEDAVFFNHHFVSHKGKEKLKSEFPRLWKEFALDNLPATSD